MNKSKTEHSKKGESNNNERLKNCRCYYIIANKRYSLGKTNKLIIEDCANVDYENYNYYEMFEQKNLNKTELIKFRDNFFAWCEEIRKKETLFKGKPRKILYSKYSSHNNSIIQIFLNWSRENLQKYRRTDTIKETYFEDILNYEFDHIEMCRNSGLAIINKKLLDIVLDCHAVDYSSFYPNILSNPALKFEFPTTQGKLSKYVDMKKSLKFGIYHCRITCDNPAFNLIFMYSEDDYYTHRTINFCFKYKQKFNIIIEFLGLDDDFNCVVWEKTELVQSCEIFKDWFEVLNQLKAEFKENMLVKTLMSSLWGHITQFNKIKKNEEEYYDVDLSEESNLIVRDTKIYYDENGDPVTTFIIIDKTNAYKHGGFARMKPFLMAEARRFVAEEIINSGCDIENDIIKIATDGIIATKDLNFIHEYKPKIDNKNTGKFIYKSFREKTKIE